MIGLTEAENESVVMVGKVVSAISFAACSVVVFTSFRFENLRNRLNFRMVLRVHTNHFS